MEILARETQGYLQINPDQSAARSNQHIALWVDLQIRGY